MICLNCALSATYSGPRTRRIFYSFYFHLILLWSLSAQHRSSWHSNQETFCFCLDTGGTSLRTSTRQYPSTVGLKWYLLSRWHWNLDLNVMLGAFSNVWCCEKWKHLALVFFLWLFSVQQKISITWNLIIAVMDFCFHLHTKRFEIALIWAEAIMFPLFSDDQTWFWFHYLN